MIDRAVYRFIEHELYNYEYYQKEFELQRRMILESSPSPSDGQPRGNKTGDPTADKALKLAGSMGLINLERTINAITQTIKELNEVERDVWENVYVKCRKDKVRICQDLCISESRLKRAKLRIITRTGVKLGLIRN